MTVEDRVKLLLGRLWAACERLPEYGGGLWGRGVAVLERKYGVEVWLSGYEVHGMIEGGLPTMTITWRREEM